MRILSFGFGSIAQRHINNLAATYPISSLSVFLPRDSKGITYRPHFDQHSLNINIIYDASSLSEYVLSLASSDIVLIASPSVYHVEHLLLTLALCRREREKSPIIIVEKPLLINHKQLLDLKNFPPSYYSNVFVVSQLRVNPAYRLIRETISDGALGDLRFVTINTHEAIQLWHPWEDYKKSYAVKHSLGGGCLLTQMHDLELLTSLLGFPSSTTLVRGQGDALNVDCDDYYALLSSGFSSSDVYSVTCEVSYNCKSPMRNYEFIFDEGSLHCDLLSAKCTLTKNSQSHIFNPTFDRNSMYLTLAQSVFDVNPSLFSGLVPFHESLKFHEWLTSLI